MHDPAVLLELLSVVSQDDQQRILQQITSLKQPDQLAQIVVDVVNAIQIRIVLRRASGVVSSWVVARQPVRVVTDVCHDGEQEGSTLLGALVEPATDRLQRRPILPSERGD